MESYIDFVDTTPTDRKTHIWEIRAKRDNFVLGAVMWFGRWRQYTFAPTGKTVWSSSCLDEVKVFVEEANETHKRKRE